MYGMIDCLINLLVNLLCVIRVGVCVCAAMLLLNIYHVQLFILFICPHRILSPFAECATD